MAKLVRNWELVPGEAMVKPGHIPPEPSAGAVDANPGQAGHCLAPLPRCVCPRPWAPQECGTAGRGDPCSRWGSQLASRLGSTALGALGLGQRTAWKRYVGGSCRAWARPHFVYSFSLLFCLTIYSWLPFSHGGCVYLALLSWSPLGSCAAAEQSHNPGAASAAMGAPV